MAPRHAGLCVPSPPVRFSMSTSVATLTQTVPAGSAPAGQINAAPPSAACEAAEKSQSVERLLWSSPVVATASAVSALVLSEQHSSVLGSIGDLSDIDSAYQGDLSELLVGSTHWLARQQQADGGWSAVANEPSDLPTTMIVRAMFQLTGIPAAYNDLNDRMCQFIKKQGGLKQLETTYGATSNLALYVRGCYALAEVIDPNQQAIVPIETACIGQGDSRVAYWAHRGLMQPAIVALGIASHRFRRSLNPIACWRRGRACERALQWLMSKQNSHGGFDGSVPATSLVVMSLASVGQTATPVVRRGVEFLFENVQGDGSWSPTQDAPASFNQPR